MSDAASIEDSKGGATGVADDNNGSGGCMVKVSTAVNNGLTRAFRGLGRIGGKYPWVVVGVSLFVSFALASSFANFKTESRPENLFVPQGTRSLGDKSDIELYYGQPIRFVSLLMETDPAGGNMLEKAVLEKAIEFWDTVQTFEAKTEKPEAVYVLDDLCQKVGIPAACNSFSIFSAWGNNPATLSADPNPIATLSSAFPPQVLEALVGGIERDVGGNIVSAKALRSSLFLNNNLTDQTPDDNDNRLSDPAAEAWEEELVEQAVDFGSGVINIYPQSAFSFGTEIGGSIVGDVPLVTSSYFIIIFFVIFVLNDRCDRVEGSIALALTSVSTILLAILSAFGLCQYLDIRYGNTHTILIFIILGVGADGTFILANAWRRERAANLADRAADTLAHAGVSLTVSSLTNVLAFSIGSLTVIPDLSSFAKYAAFSLFFLWIYLCTFYVSVLTLNERRLRKNKLDCLCCITDGRVSAARDPEGEIKAAREAKRELPYSVSKLSKFMENSYGPFITKGWFSIFVVVAAFAFVAVCGWQASTLTVEATGSNFIPDDSYLKNNFDLQAQYFGGAPTEVSIVVKDFNIMRDTAELWTMADKFKCATCRSEPPYVDPNFQYWLQDFVDEFIVPQTGNANLAANADVDGKLFPTTETEFNSQLASWLSTTPAAAARYARDIVFDETTGKVIRARIRLNLDPIGEENDEGIFKEDAVEIVDAVDKLYEICDAFAMTVYPYSTKFVNDWSSYKIIAEELLQNTLLCLVCVLVVVSLLIGHPVTSALVFFSTCFTIVELLGLLAIFGYAIDTVVVVLVVLAIGLSVDYSAHLAFSFMLEQGTRKERVAKVLGDVGVPVLNGAISTFLAICLQSLSSSYVFRVVFICFFFSIIASILNGLVLLPIALGLVGPKPYHKSVKSLDN